MYVCIWGFMVSSVSSQSLSHLLFFTMVMLFPTVDRLSHGTGELPLTAPGFYGVAK